uniref:DNA 3'-5' helicase n=1 Tax=Entomoneis paludosa TaxID=265537 RepID=A0A7S2YGB8_9STRA
MSIVDKDQTFMDDALVEPPPPPPPMVELDNSLLLENLNEAQIEAVTQPLESTSRVLAGPGSGKTRVLTCRIAHLLRHTHNEKILAVTFTKKAAGEMQERVQELLTSLQTHEEESKPPPAPSPYDDIDPYDDGAYGAELEEALVVYEGGNAEPLSPLEQRVRGAVSWQMRRVTLGTFHSTCARILRMNREYLNSLSSVVKHSPNNDATLDGNFAIADQAEQLRIVKEILKEREINEKDLKGVKLNTILNVISNCKEEFAQGKNPFRPKGNKPLPETLKVAAQLYDAYREKLISTNQMDFDDLIYLTRELLAENDDVRDRMRQRWSHVLVDEFQDTSLSQLDLVKLLTSNSLFVVGDADQSIYSWRGAHVGMMADFNDHFPDAKTVYLMENYRSTSNIVKAAQKVISSGKTDSIEAEMRQDMKPKREAGPKPRIIACDDDKGEADLVIKKIKQGVEAGEYGKNHEVAIVYRTNAQSRALEESCVQLNVPYVIFGSATSFYKRQEVKDCLCFLRWLANGKDRGSMLRCLEKNAKGIGMGAIAEFESYCNAVLTHYGNNLRGTPQPTPLDLLLSIADRSRIHESSPPADSVLGKRARTHLLAFSTKMNSIYDLALKESVAKVLTHVIDSLDLLALIDKRSKSTSEFEERQENVRELQQASERYTDGRPCLGSANSPTEGSEQEDSELTPLATFLEDIALVTELADASKKDSDEHRFVVCLMTIHTSKGMEFDTVFIVGNEDGTFPTSQALEEGPGSVQLEEEKRLCYVAMTRAKTELIMTWRKAVRIFTPTGVRTTKRHRSQFIDVLVASKPKKGSAQMESGGTKKSSNQRRSGTTNIYGQGTNNIYGQAPPKPSKAVVTERAGTTNIYGNRQGTNSYGQSSKSSPSRSRFTTSRNSQSPATPNRSNPLDRENGYASHTSRRSLSSFARQAQQPTPNKSRRATAQRGGSASAVPSARARQPSKSSPNRSPKPKASALGGGGSVDSSWFFPIGSEVIHAKLGRGIVLPPPPATESNDMPVRVKFSSGDHQVFDARGPELSPAVSR